MLCYQIRIVVSLTSYDNTPVTQIIASQVRILQHIMEKAETLFLISLAHTADYQRMQNDSIAISISLAT